MRRSVRDAIVGFSIVGALVAFTGSLMWIRGIRLSSKTWSITANFSDASGLAERSPVTFRGILVGSVGKIHVTPQAVLARLEIDNEELRLPMPVFAKVVRGSLLGGDAQVSLISNGKPLPKDASLPGLKDCNKKKMLCDGAIIIGAPLTSISTVSETIERLLDQVEQEDVVYNLVSSAQQFDQTQRNLDELINQMKAEVLRAEPSISNLNEATNHIKNIVAALDNPKTLNDLKQSASSIRSLSAKIDAVGGNLEQLLADEELMSAVRKITIGLGEFFHEIYPGKS